MLGLKPDIRAGVEPHMPESVQEAVTLALIHEEQLDNGKKGHKLPYPAKQGQYGNRGDHLPNKPPTGVLWKAKQLKDYRRANGLCFKCGDKFAPGHQCAIPVVAQLKALEGGPTILSDELLDTLTEAEHTEDGECMHISVNAVAGTENAKTIRLQAHVKDKTLLILIDSGSSHSFLDQSVVDLLQCPTVSTLPTHVKVANGDILVCSAEVPSFNWWVQGHTFQHPMKVLALGGYDCILGMDWLEQQGAMVCQWKERWIQFSYKGRMVTLQGVVDQSQQPPTEPSHTQFLKWQASNEIWATALVTLVAKPVANAIPAPIQQVLDQYTTVFQENLALPPHRAYDHSINLIPGATPVNSRPYRYSPLQKDEIEKQVRENATEWHHYS